MELLQFICTWPALDLVVAITSEFFTDDSTSCRLLTLVAQGLDFDSDDEPSGRLPEKGEERRGEVR